MKKKNQMGKKIIEFLNLSKKITELRKELEKENINLRLDGYAEYPVVQIIFKETGFDIIDMLDVESWETQHLASEKFKDKTIFNIDGVECFFLY